MVEYTELVKKWHANGGKGIPVLLLPSENRTDYLVGYSCYVNKPIVVDSNTAVGVLFNSIEEGEKNVTE